MSSSITIMFDDNDASIYNEAFPRMKALGIKGNIACIANTVGMGGMFTLANLHEMYDAGWDICSHTANHVDMTLEDDATIITNVAAGQAYLNAQGFTRSDDILIAPVNGITEHIRSIISPYVTMTCTTIAEGLNTANNQPVDLMRIRRRGVGNNSVQTVKDWIDDAILKNQHLHFNFHKVSLNATTLDYPPDDLGLIMQYIISSGIQVFTMSELRSRVATISRVAISRRLADKDSGAALRFDGVGDVVNVVDNASLAFSGTAPISIAAWVKPDNTGTMRIISQGGEIILRANGTSKEYEFILNSFTTNDRVISGDLIPGAWTHVVGVYDGDLKLYVNGSLVERVTPTGGYIDVGTVWKIGHDTTEQFKGLMDEVQIFNIGLTQKQIIDLYTVGIVPAGRVGAWLMDEGSGTSLADSSGRGNVGTIIGSTWSTEKRLVLRPTSPRRKNVVDFSNALFFAGLTSEVALTNTISLSGPFTISWWEKLRGRSDLRMVIGESVTVTSKIGHSSSKWFVRIISGGPSDNIINLPLAHVWTHVSLTRDENNKVDLWIDGVATRLFADAAQAGNFVFNRIGSSQGTGRLLGFLDKFRVWGFKLTTAQLLDLYYDDTLPVGLVLNYEFNAASGTVVADSAGTNTGTATGTTWSTNPISINRTVS